MVAIPDTINFLGSEIPFVYVMGAVAAGILVCCACCWRKCCKTRPIPTGEHFRWPSSSRFLKRTDPAHPPPLFVNKYEDPMRTDQLPEDAESHWVVLYEPNGNRDEVKQQMYLRFKDGVVFGLGFETIRKLCKISGKYKYDKRSNQTKLAMTCRFSNELDTVMFHGCGNGTGFIGNCFISELDRFSTFAGVPGLRLMSGDKFKGSFLLLKMSSMGDPQLRARLHSRRVHKWAGELFPDETVEVPLSPMHSPTRSVSSKAGDSYSPVEEVASTTGSTGSNRSPRFRSKRPVRRGSASSTPSRGQRKKLFGLFPTWRRKRPSLNPTHPGSPTGGQEEGRSDEFPPWVQKGADFLNNEEEEEEGRRFSPTSSARGDARPFAPPIDGLNYLEVDGVPGRNGPAMV